MSEKTIINGVEITTDGEVTHFRIPDESPSSTSMTQKKEEQKQEIKKEGFFGRVWNWLVKHEARPYVKIRDLADPFGDRTDPDAGSDGKNGIETGIKISF